jgi:hypothetical protein
VPVDVVKNGHVGLVAYGFWLAVVLCTWRSWVWPLGELVRIKLAYPSCWFLHRSYCRDVLADELMQTGPVDANKLSVLAESNDRSAVIKQFSSRSDGIGGLGSNIFRPICAALKMQPAGAEFVHGCPRYGLFGNLFRHLVDVLTGRPGQVLLNDRYCIR